MSALFRKGIKLKVVFCFSLVWSLSMHHSVTTVLIKSVHDAGWSCSIQNPKKKLNWINKNNKNNLKRKKNKKKQKHTYIFQAG